MSSIPQLQMPQIESPLDNVAKALSVKDMVQRSRVGDIQVQQAEQQQRDQQTVMQTLAAKPGATLHDILPEISGKVSPQFQISLQKMDLETQKTLGEKTELDLKNDAASHAKLQEIFNNVMNMPDDQLAQNWPAIAQTVNSIPGLKSLKLDPSQPMGKAQLQGFGPVLGLNEAYLANEVAKRKATAEAKTAGLKGEGGVLYDVTGEKPVQVAGNPPVAQQELSSWLNTKEANGKTRAENGKTATDYQQAAETKTSTQSDSLGITTSTTSAPGLNRGAAPSNPALAPNAAPTARPSAGQAPPTGKVMTPAQAINAGVHGDDFLKTVSPSIRNTVKRIGDYQDDESMLTRITTKHPEVLSYISQYAPDFDRTNYDAKRKLMIDYTSGVHSKEINAVNTAMGHVAELGDAIDALKNGDIKVINSIANKLQIQTGGTAAATVALIARRVAPEIATVYTPSGGGQTERIADEKDFDFSLGQDILKKNVAKTVDLLRSKIGALENQYKNTVGRDDFEKRFITPQAKQALQKYSTQAVGAPQGGGISVQAPNGKAYTFPDQASADAFKQKAGIQ